MRADVLPVPAIPDVLPFFKALADESRLTIVRTLAVTDLRVGELVALLGQPQNAVSYHLKHLRQLGLLHDRRSSDDARDVYYRVDVERLQQLYATVGDVLQTTAHANPQAPAVADQDSTTAPPLRILFLCHHNRARSQLAEGLTRYLAGDQVEVASAGSEPGDVHPLTIKLLEEWGIDTRVHTSKSLQTFAGHTFDYIVTTCDRVRGGCPVFPGDPVQIHWSFPDPTASADPEEQYRAFSTVRRELLTRIRYLLSRPHPRTGVRLTLRPAQVLAREP